MDAPFSHLGGAERKRIEVEDFTYTLAQNHERPGHGRAVTVALELTGCRDADGRGERIILRDLQGAQEQVIYTAGALDRGNLVQALAILVQHLRRLTTADDAGDDSGTRAKTLVQAKVG